MWMNENVGDVDCRIIVANSLQPNHMKMEMKEEAKEEQKSSYEIVVASSVQ